MLPYIKPFVQSTDDSRPLGNDGHSVSRLVNHLLLGGMVCHVICSKCYRRRCGRTTAVPSYCCCTTNIRSVTDVYPSPSVTEVYRGPVDKALEDAELVLR